MFPLSVCVSSSYPLQSCSIQMGCQYSCIFNRLLHVCGAGFYTCACHCCSALLIERCQIGLFGPHTRSTLNGHFTLLWVSVSTFADIRTAPQHHSTTQHIHATQHPVSQIILTSFLSESLGCFWGYLALCYLLSKNAANWEIERGPFLKKTPICLEQILRKVPKNYPFFSAFSVILTHKSFLKMSCNGTEWFEHGKCEDWSSQSDGLYTIPIFLD